ncbi:putative amidohydrolase [Fulvitalea axinellae]|uniref:Amidohydrolase n=1 Tax=Fulvitalea axinellae TaxID=1182444 RepID=A0AAU9CX05_9BACT|nr:putative amidohydrolase [Fulvitalea axinellae]
MKSRYFCAILFGLTLSVFACSSKKQEEAPSGKFADWVFVNGIVYLMDTDLTKTEAIAISADTITALGKNGQVDDWIGPNTKVVDLKGRMLMPGFVESHIHPAVAGLLNTGVQLLEFSTKKEIMEALKAYSERHPYKKAIFGFGWSNDLFEPNGPHKSELDSVIHNRPVFLIANDAHSAWVNSEALELLDIGKDTPDPLPGVHFYKRDKNGEPTGWLVEGGAFWPQLPKLGLGSSSDFKQGLKEILPVLASFGITSLFDAGVPGLERYALAALTELERDDDLPVRYYTSHYVTSPTEAEDAVKDFLALKEEFTSELVIPSAIKIPNDGTIEAETAALLEPYTDHPKNSGAVMLDQETLTRLLIQADSAGIDTHIHAIGDRTAHEALNAIKASQDKTGRKDTRHTICHLQLVREKDIKRFANLGVIAQVSPQWPQDLHSTYYKLWVKELGKRRANHQFEFRTFLKNRVIMSLGSDFPATGGTLTESSPMYGIETGRTRQVPGKPNSFPIPQKSERVSVAELLRGYTYNGAYQLRSEKQIGSLKVGKKADVIILDENPLTVPVHQLHATQVLFTMMGGKVTHNRLNDFEFRTGTDTDLREIIK